MIHSRLPKILKILISIYVPNKLGSIASIPLYVNSHLNLTKIKYIV